MAGKPKKPKGQKFQPSKYDWLALETEYLTGDIDSVAEFFRLRTIPKKTYERKSVGWGEKRQAYRAQAHKVLRKGWLKDSITALRDQLQINLSVAQGVKKVGVEGLIPGQDGTKALKPKTAAEAAKLLELSTRMERNTLSTLAILEGMLKDTPVFPAGGADDDGKPAPNVVIIDIPSNTKEAKELPGS